MESIILLAAVILLVSLLLRRVSAKLGIPMLLAFILLGMLFGSDGIFKIPFDNFSMAEQICSFALIFIMFYGGFGTSWKSAKPVAVQAALLSTVGVGITAAAVGLFCYLALHISFWESMLIGAVISSTDAASVFSVLRSRRLNLKDHTAPLLELESGSNDPFSYMLTIVVLSVLNGEGQSWQFLLAVAGQVVFGLAVGAAAAGLTVLALTHMKDAKDGVSTMLVFTVALLSYAAASAIGGNGYLSVYITGIILGNWQLDHKKEMVHFFDGLTGLMQILIFFLLGLLSFPSQLPNVALFSLLIAVFLTFVARPLAIFSILTPFRCPIRQQLLVSWAGLRGAASIVFAIVATVHPAYMKHDVFHMVFFIVLFSITIQGSLIPAVARKLGMIDDNGNILKTFNDYSEEVPVQFVQLRVDDQHPWANCQVKDLAVAPGLLLVLLLRDKKRIIPRGGTRILPGDVVILSALSVENTVGGALTELVVDSDSEWLGKPLRDLPLGEEKLIVAIKRGDRIWIPNGKVVAQENDIFVISQITECPPD